MNKRILVIDDDATTCEVIRVILEDFGFELMSVHDSEQALQVARDAPPSLILLDLSLPDADALQLCSTLKREPSTQDSIVVLMTHPLSEDDLEGIQTSEADAQVSKPFSPIGLLAIVQECLQRQGSASSSVA
jgi:DNA-binding response OmpR family regulator